MKFTCLQENLTKGVQTVYRAVPAKSPLPILSNILLHAKNNKLKLAASNMETTITTYVGASIDKDGAITVPARLIRDFVANLSPDTVDATLIDETLHLKSEKTKSHFNGITAEDFPDLPGFPEDKSFIELDPAAFTNAIASVAFAAGTDVSHPFYAGIYLEYAEKKLTFVGLDGFRLAIKTIDVDSEAEPFNTIIPAKTLVEVARIFSASEDTVKMVLSAGENLVIFGTEDTTIATRIIDGTYPNYKAVVPTEFSISATFAAQDFLDAVKLANVFAKTDDNKAVKMVLDTEGTIRISSLEEESGKHESEIAAEVTGNAVELTFNSKYLLDFLNNIKTEEVTITTSGAATPCKFAPVGHENFTHVIMPMQI
jgi:DNA polymerase-3 subunit beta